MPELGRVIRQEIKDKGPITFARFMELALYHPEHGYYSSGNASIGKAGDFYTNSHLGRTFGRLIFETFLKLGPRTGPGRASFVEMGAGEGYMAKDFLEAARERLGDGSALLDYVIVESSHGMREKQMRTLGALSGGVRWFSSVDDIPDTLDGVFFSNELVDAFPFHRVCQCGELLKEVYVTADGLGELAEYMGSVSSPEIPRHLNRIGVMLPSGVTTEVCLEARRWMRSVSGRLGRGFVITVDYGYPAVEYYSHERAGGTMKCYHRHTSNEQPLERAGSQDITAHVDFTSLAMEGREAGLAPLLYTDQSSFLMEAACDLEAYINNNGGDQERLEELGRGLKALVHPEWMGGAFNVLVQARGVDASGIFPRVKDRMPDLWERPSDDSFILS